MIVNPETLNHLKRCRDDAQRTTEYPRGYRYAMEGLNAAIATLETLQMAERNSHLTIKTD